MKTISKTATDKAWDELLNDTAPTPAVTLPVVNSELTKLGPRPFRFTGLTHGASKCALCGKRITNLYGVQAGDGSSHFVGSECILGMANGFEAHLVGQVKVAKRNYDAQKRAAREAARREQERKAALESTEKEYAPQAAWLRAYKGYSSFYESLQRQLAQNGGLSPRQWECVSNAIAKANEPKPERVFSLAVGTTLIVSKFFARIIGEKTGLTRPHFAIEILGVEAETEKAYKVTAKLSAQRTAHCCVCGKRLTNPNSVAAGIGPICGGFYEVDNLEALAEKLRSVEATVDMWIPKSQIKEERKPNEAN